MSMQIDPKEVLEHLEYLGYSSITKEQLKEFIRDLKRLIKYEQNKEKMAMLERREPLGDKRVSVACETSFPFDEQMQPFYEENPKIIENLSSRNYVNLSPGSGNKSDAGRSSFIVCADKSSDRSYHPHDYIEEDNNEKECMDPSCSCKKIDEKSKSKTTPKKCCAETDKPLQPIPSFIRPCSGKPSKSDPVALYHYYQNEWSKRSLPGEDPRTDLRWAIRSRLAQRQQASQRTRSKENYQKRKIQT